MSLAEEVRLSRSLPEHQRARQIREAAGLGVSRIATEVGVSRQTLTLWEAGKRRPRGEARLRYARVLAELENAIQAA